VLAEGTPDKQQLEGRLVEILHRISGADPAVITSDARLMEDIGIDSLGFYEILIEADTCFGIRIQEEQLLQFKTVGDIQTHLESLEIDPTNSKTA
jgi:acyl carrier protein